MTTIILTNVIYFIFLLSFLYELRHHKNFYKLLIFYTIYFSLFAFLGLNDFKTVSRLLTLYLIGIFVATQYRAYWSFFTEYYLAIGFFSLFAIMVGYLVANTAITDLLLLNRTIFSLFLPCFLAIKLFCQSFVFNKKQNCCFLVIGALNIISLSSCLFLDDIKVNDTCHVYDEKIPVSNQIMIASPLEVYMVSKKSVISSHPRFTPQEQNVMNSFPELFATYKIKWEGIFDIVKKIDFHEKYLGRNEPSTGRASLKLVGVKNQSHVVKLQLDRLRFLQENNNLVENLLANGHNEEFVVEKLFDRYHEKYQQHLTQLESDYEHQKIQYKQHRASLIALEESLAVGMDKAFYDFRSGGESGL